MSDSGHCISCEHFRRTDSLPKRDNHHCKLSVDGVELDLMHQGRQRQFRSGKAIG